MTFNVFAANRTEESVAYDMALAIASKEPDVTTPESLIERIADLLPACREAAIEKYKSEDPSRFMMTIIKR
ncbi:hypothetical protein HX37_20975 [Salmonella enterica]|uniref:Uncharacterized protein n=1 Tax=Salmonella enterica TaxID=28901 RepID=A0A5U2F9A0_SALER|nr:hypothetical protein [Salmonella enterica]HAK1938943.1 hypothetical protein [Salmonella enterica]